MHYILNHRFGRAFSVVLFCIVIYFVNGLSGYPSKEMAVASSIGQMMIFIVFYYEFIITRILVEETES